MIERLEAGGSGGATSANSGAGAMGTSYSGGTGGGGGAGPITAESGLNYGGKRWKWQSISKYI